MSSPSRYIRLILAEYGQSTEFIDEKPWRRRAEFLAINPAGTLPVLENDDGDHICGGLVTGEYLDETCGAMMRDKRLMPENPAGRAEVRRLVDWFLVKFEAEVIRYLVHERVHKQLMRGPDGGGPPDAAAIRAGRINLKNHLKYVAWLAGRNNWLAGRDMTQADLAGAAALSVLDYLGEIDWEEHAGVKDWYAKIKSRPSFRSLLGDKVSGLPPSSHYIDLDF